ncbi:putative phospholipase [Helianthus annuus]|nr:putative phospholipase [Helianthus annuus]
MSSGRQFRSRSRKDVPTSQPFMLHTDTEFETKSTPNDLCCALNGLSAAQKADLKDMGFASLTAFNIHKIPVGLGRWLLVNYSHETNELNVGSHVIKVTTSKVHDVFGVPMGDIPVYEHKRKRMTDVFREEWKNQFFQTSVTINDVIQKLKLRRQGGKLFKLNFLVLFNSIMGETTKRATVNPKFLASIRDEGDICKMDWCSYMITCLNRTKEGWNGKEPYYGPLTFLAVLYAHELQLKRNPENAITPAIKYVTNDYLVDLESSLHGKGLISNDNVEAYVQMDEGQTAVDQNVNVSRDKEDEIQFHSTNADVTSVQTGLLSYLKLPAGDATRNFTERRITHCNQLESLRDENLLDGDDIQMIEPKQEECELDEDASRLILYLENLPARKSGMVYVKTYKVSRDIAPTLIDIMRKHGDIAAACVLTSDLKSSILESVCKIFRRIQTNDIVDMLEEEKRVSDAKKLNIDVSWLEPLFEDVRKRKEANKRYGLCLEMKVGIVMAKRVAQKDLRDRRAELVAAQERLEAAERRVAAMHLVEKNLTDRLHESESDLSK